MRTVSYYMKGKPKESRSFLSIDGARAFMLELNKNPDCEAYYLEK